MGMGIMFYLEDVHFVISVESNPRGLICKVYYPFTLIQLIDVSIDVNKNN